MISLLKESGYFDSYTQITEDTFRDIIYLEQGCIQDWLEFSNNKRISSGWYFKQENPRKYIVGYFSNTLNKKSEIIFENPINACAAYVKREIESIRAEGGGVLN